MNALAIVLIIKIIGTVLMWCLPLLLFPSVLLEALGFPEQDSYLFVRLLGWAYLALCVGYGFALKAALNGRRLMGPIWVGVVSNGGAFVYLLYYGLQGTWSNWGMAIQAIAWTSVVATALITSGLILFGVLGRLPRTDG
ncbi:MAG: hypothetical protein AAGJ52_03750 [Pseudomonadota bacterium]